MPYGIQGRIDPRAYIAITGVSLSTATRDLADMVRKGALVRTGKRRLARYLVNVPQRFDAE
jgi:Fic family protein